MFKFIDIPPLDNLVVYANSFKAPFGETVGPAAASAGLDEPVFRLMTGLLLSFLWAAGERGQGTIRSLWHTLAGCATLYYCFGGQVILCVLPVVFTYLVLQLVHLTGQSRYVAVSINFIAQMGYLFYAYALYATDEDYDVNWTTPMCVLTLRLIGVTFDYADGGNPKATSDQAVNRLVSPPGLIPLLGFSLYYGSVLAGPQFTFVRYQAYAEDRLLDEKARAAGTPYGMAARKLALAVVYLAASTVGTAMFPNTMFWSPEYLSAPLATRLVNFFFMAKFATCKYVGVWLIVESAALVAGFGYEGPGSDSYNGAANVRPYLLETTPEIGGVIAAFNINTNDWSKRYIFKRLRFLGNRHLSSMGTLLFLCVWHGSSFGYFMTFFLEFLFVDAERRVMDRFGRPNNSTGLARLLLIANRQMIIAYGYAPFETLTYTRTMHMYSTVGFFLHYAAAFIVVADLVLPRAKKEKVAAKKE
jgi:lysophospholipid acyltransferase 5